MTFTWPWMLAALALVPLALVAYLFAQRRRMRYAVRFTNLDLLANVVKDQPRWRRHVPPALALLALAALVLALARPQATFAVPREEATVMLATDVSGSMQATDVQPSRLVAAQRAATTFTERLPEQFRLGALSFNEEAQVLVPPSTDRSLVRRAVDGFVAGGGTAMGDALARSLETVRSTVAAQERESQARDRDQPTDREGGQPPGAIVLLSDGANTVGAADPLQVAREARGAGIPITTIALGTAEGRITAPDQFGVPQSAPVPPDTETLREIAEISGGRFFAAPDAAALDAVYADLGTRLGFERERQEITAGFAGAGLVLLLIGSALSLRWFNRFP